MYTESSEEAQILKAQWLQCNELTRSLFANWQDSSSTSDRLANVTALLSLKGRNMHDLPPPLSCVFQSAHTFLF